MSNIHKKLFFSAIVLIIFLCIIAFCFFKPTSTPSSNKTIDISVYMPPDDTIKIFAIHNPEDKIVCLEEEILSESTEANTIDYTSTSYWVHDDDSTEAFLTAKGFYLLENEFISVTGTDSTLGYINTEPDYIIYNTFSENFPKVSNESTRCYITPGYSTLTTPVGEYKTCIEVITETKGELTTKTYYAPNIGKVTTMAETEVGSNDFFLFEQLIDVKPSNAEIITPSPSSSSAAPSNSTSISISKEDEAIALIKKLRPDLDKPNYNFLVDNTFTNDKGDQMYSIQCYETITDNSSSDSSHTSTIDWLSVNLTKQEVIGMFDDTIPDNTSPNIELQLLNVSDDLSYAFEDSFSIIENMFSAVLNSDSSLPPTITSTYPNGNKNIGNHALFQYNADTNVAFLVFNYTPDINDLVEGSLNGIPIVDILPGVYSLLEYDISDYFSSCKKLLAEKNVVLPKIDRYVYVFQKDNGEYMSFSLNHTSRFEINIKLNEYTDEMPLSESVGFIGALRVPYPHKQLSGEYSNEYLLYQFYEAEDLLSN